MQNEQAIPSSKKVCDTLCRIVACADRKGYEDERLRKVAAWVCKRAGIAPDMIRIVHNGTLRSIHVQSGGMTMTCA